MSNVICEMLGIKYPIFQGAMAWVSDSSLAAAVSNAGGLGIIAGANAPAEHIRNEIRKTKEMTDKPFGVKVAQVGKIITVGLVGGSAIFLGEVFEKFLLTIPGMQIELPLIGTLANMIGLFLSSLVSGLVGAIVLNLIDKFIAKKLKAESDKKIIERKNEIMNLQQIQTFVVQNNVSATRESTINEILRNHETVNVESVQLINKIFDENNERYSKEIKSSKNISSNQSDLDQMQKDLEEMQKDLEGLL